VFLKYVLWKWKDIKIICLIIDYGKKEGENKLNEFAFI
jgi:hypothetical protein